MGLHPVDASRPWAGCVDKVAALAGTLFSVLAIALFAVSGAHSAAQEDRRIHEVRYRDYLIRVHKAIDSATDEKIEILRDDKLLFVAEDHRVQATDLNIGPDGPYDPIGVGEDVTGDGQPNLVVRLHSGGAHCCDTFLIIAVGARFRLINRLDTRDYGIVFRDLDDAPGFEIETLDATFAYWKAPFAGSPAPRVVLAYRDGKYRPAPDLMRRPSMAEPVLNTRAKRIRDGGRWDWHEMYSLDGRLWAVMLDLIYSGNAVQARAFLDMAWPLGRPDKNEFADELFRCQLRWSQYWPTIAAMNGLPPRDPEPVGDCTGFK